jgi:hypothetical protein
MMMKAERIMSFTLLKDQLRMIYHVLTYINHKTSTPSLFFIFILVHFIDSSHVNHYNLLNAAWLWSHSHICFLHYHYLTIFILHYYHSSFTIIPFVKKIKNSPLYPYLVYFSSYYLYYGQFLFFVLDSSP